MQRSDAAILVAATTNLSAAMMMKVALTIEVERQRQCLSAKCRPKYRLPLEIPQGPDFSPEMFNESWA